MKFYGISKIFHVIMHVVRNDAASGTDIEYFEEMFDELINIPRKQIAIVRFCFAILVQGETRVHQN